MGSRRGKGKRLMGVGRFSFEDLLDLAILVLIIIITGVEIWTA